MEKVVEIQEARKVWSSPELKKVDIEQITANNLYAGHDGPSSNGS